MNQNMDRDAKILGTYEYMKVDESKYPEKKKDKWKEYLDFELEINTGTAREYPVTIIRSPAGEASEIMHFPYEEQVLENHLISLKNIIEPSDGSQNELFFKDDHVVQDFGKDLFLALFAGEIRNRYDVSIEKARIENKGLRIKLRLRAPELAALPWEFMFDPRIAEYICLSLNTLIVRYPEIPQPVQPLAVKLPLRILGMIAIPDNLMPLDVEYEKRWIENAIQYLKAEGRVELTWLPGQTWRDLAEAMQTGDWNVFHFIGHGGFDRNSNEGFIALADEHGQKHLLGATELGMLLADNRGLRLVILNCCKGARGSETDIFSSTASILARRGIPAVIAMQYRISDKAAIEFSRTFYKALANRMPVDAAVAAARQAISIEVKNTVEWGTPVLIMHSSEGVLFKEEDRIKEDVEIKEDEETEEEIREELAGNIETVEQFISFILAKQNAIFQHERNGRKSYKVPTEGISEISTQIKAIDNEVSVTIRISGMGRVPGQFYDKIRKELKHFKEA